MLELFRNGESAPDISFFSGAHLGHGIFETFILKIRNAGREKIGSVLGLDLHLQRLSRGIERFSLFPIELENIHSLLTKLVDNYHSDLKIRIVIYSNDWLLSVESLSSDSYISGVSVVKYEGERAYPEHKSCSALTSVMASRYAKTNGAYEALLVDPRGVVREGAWSNFFWCDKSGVLYTQPDKILPGITRELVLQTIPTSIDLQYREVTWSELIKESTGLFLTQSTHGLIPVTKIDNINIPTLTNCNVYSSILECYQESLTLRSFRFSVNNN